MLGKQVTVVQISLNISLNFIPAAKRSNSTVECIRVYIHGHSVCKMLWGVKQKSLLRLFSCCSRGSTVINLLLVECYIQS